VKILHYLQVSNITLDILLAIMLYYLQVSNINSQKESSILKWEERTRVMVEKIDRRTTDTKERIIQEALQLYKQGGFAAVKLNDITKVLHVTRAALYNHFPEGKDQIFLEALASMAQHLETRITEIIDAVPDTRQRLREVLFMAARTPYIVDLELVFTAKEEFSQTMKDRIEEIMRPLLNKMSFVLLDGMARGDLRTVNLPLAFACFGLLVQQVKKLSHNPVRFLPEMSLPPLTDDLIDQMLDIWLTGMGNREQRDLPTGADVSSPN
jgi:AcrR family transcriptional regulator